VGEGVFTGFDSATDSVSGAGPVESAVQTFDSLGRLSEGDFLEAGLNVGAFGLDLLGAAMDPLGALASAGISWLIEHISFLRDPLDKLMGDPDTIKEGCQKWNDTALKLDEIAKQQKQALDSQVQSWEKSAADAFRKSHGQLSEEIAAVSKACTGMSETISNCGIATAALRGMVRDMIATFIWEVIRNAVIALAGSFATFGAAAAAFAAWTVGRGAMLLGKIASYMTKLIGAVGKVVSRLKTLLTKVDDIVRGMKRFGRSADSPASTRPTGATDAPPGPRSPGSDSPPAPTRASNADTTPDAPNSPSISERLDNWGQKKVDDSKTDYQRRRDEIDEKYQGSAWQRYKDSGATYDNWNRGRSWNNSTAEGISNAYTPYSPLERGSGGPMAHSVPNLHEGAGFVNKFAGDLFREGTKADDMKNEVSEPKTDNKNQADQIKNSQGDRVKEIRDQ
jgi:hypothetical protein